MGAPRNLYRRLDVDHEPLVGREHSGIVERDHAEQGSRRLAAMIELSGLCPETVAPRTRTFEEQLALVEAGRARVVAKPALRIADDRTLAGVSSEWMA